MGNVIDTYDPMGTHIVCTDGIWYGHILVGHPDLSGNEKAVSETIETPDVVFDSNQSPSRAVYFKQSATATYNKGLYTKVVVEKSSIHEAEVVTAFVTKSPKGGIGNVIYDKSN